MPTSAQVPEDRRALRLSLLLLTLLCCLLFGRLLLQRTLAGCSTLLTKLLVGRSEIGPDVLNSRGSRVATRLGE